MLAMADRDGVIGASVPGLAKAAGVDRGDCERALEEFTSPDPDSRTPDHGGRRIEKCEGGWRLLNHSKYRELQSAEDKRAKDAERQRNKRERDMSRDITPVTKSRLSDPSPSPSASASASPTPKAKTEKRSDLAPSAPTPNTACKVEFKQRWGTPIRRRGLPVRSQGRRAARSDAQGKPRSCGALALTSSTAT